jgi:hypothetical protein
MERGVAAFSEMLFVAVSDYDSLTSTTKLFAFQLRNYDDIMGVLFSLIIRL